MAAAALIFGGWQTMVQCRAMRIHYCLIAVLLAACSPSAEKSEAIPCNTNIGTGEQADVMLLATGSCEGKLVLNVRIAILENGAVTWHDADEKLISIEGKWQLKNGAAVRDVQIKNNSAEPVRIAGVEWSATGDSFVKNADRLLHNGYQSWSFTGIEFLPKRIESVNGTARHGGDNDDFTNEIPGVSWWWTALSDDRNQGLVAGADGGTVFKTYLAATGNEASSFRIIQGVTGDSFPLAAGKTKTLDGLYLRWGDIHAGLEAYADYVQAKHTPAVKRQAALGGWGSWNVYYENPTLPLLREDLAWAKKSLAPVGLTDFLLDDGYETHWGSWAAKPAFGISLEDFNSEQAQAGFRPAVWLAPFYISVTDSVVIDHPDWFLHAADGSLRTYNNFGPNYAALDVTKLEARQFLIDAVQRYAAWGYKTIKIDFLFGGAIEGVRSEDVTALESYQLWMKTIREAAPRLHIIGCGAPLLPSVGWVDSMRTGADIAFTVSPEPAYPFFANQARQNAGRYYTDRWWSLDADVVLLRGRHIDDAEAWSAVISGALTGGNYLLGDGRQASPLRQAMALDPLVLAMTRDGVAAVPLDLTAQADAGIIATPLLDVTGRTQIPHLWDKKAGAKRWLAIFAWSDDTYTAQVPLGFVELVPPKTAGEKVTPKALDGSRRITVDKHGTRVFECRAPECL